MLHECSGRLAAGAAADSGGAGPRLCLPLKAPAKAGTSCSLMMAYSEISCKRHLHCAAAAQPHPHTSGGQAATVCGSAPFPGTDGPGHVD